MPLCYEFSERLLTRVDDEISAALGDARAGPRLAAAAELTTMLLRAKDAPALLALLTSPPMLRQALIDMAAWAKCAAA
jgi:hypothetical protein